MSTGSLFDDLPAQPAPARPPPKASGSCLECAWFAGRARDAHAVLFKQRKGYCDHEKHPWGIWNVVQNIERDTHCPNFKPTTPEAAAQRKTAAEKLWR